MREVLIHDLKTRQYNQANSSSGIMIGDPARGQLVTSFMIDNQGRNSLCKVVKDGQVVAHLRPFDTPFMAGVEWPGVYECTLQLVFEAENQQQYSGGTQPALDANETDYSQADAIYHNAVVVESIVKKVEQCPI